MAPLTIPNRVDRRASACGRIPRSRHPSLWSGSSLSKGGSRDQNRTWETCMNSTSRGGRSCKRQPQQPYPFPGFSSATTMAVVRFDPRLR